MENLILKYIENLGIIKNSVNKNKKKKQNLEENVFDDIIAKSVDKKEAVEKDRDVKNNDKDLEIASNLSTGLSYNVVNNKAENLKNVKSKGNKVNKVKADLEVNSSMFNKNLKNLYENQSVNLKLIQENPEVKQKKSLNITEFPASSANTANSKNFKNGKVLDKSNLEASNTLIVNENLNKQINQTKDSKLTQESLEIRQQKIENIIKANQLREDKASLQTENIKIIENIKQDTKRENLNIAEEESSQSLKNVSKKLDKISNITIDENSTFLIDKINTSLDNKNKPNGINNRLQKDAFSDLLKKKEEFDKLTSKIEDKKTGELKEFNFDILKSSKETEIKISVNNFNESLAMKDLQNSSEVNLYTNKNNDGNNTVATNYNNNLSQSININIFSYSDNNSNYQNNQNDNNFNKNMNGQNQNNNSSFVFSYNQTNISANLLSNTLNLVINTKDIILDDITILQIQQILKNSGFKHHNITIKDKEKVLKLYEYKAINNSNTSGINLAV
jgi:hypothetical protein